MKAVRRAWLVLGLVFVAPWLVYAGLLTTVPDSVLAAWRNEVYWPADQYITVIQGGFAMPVLAFVMFGGVGALFVGVVLGALVRGVCALLQIRDRSGWVMVLAMFVMPVWAFTMFKAVPATVTIVDATAQTLTVRRFGEYLRIPVETIVVRGDEVIALDLTSYMYYRNRTRYLQLFVLRKGLAPLRIGERACADEVEACLVSGDAEVIALAGSLGHTVGSLAGDVRAGHRVAMVGR